MIGSPGAPARVLGTLAELDSLEDAWDRVPHSWGHPMGHFPWASAAARCHQGYGRLRIFAADSGATPAALALLVERPGARPRLECLGLHEIYEPTDLVGRDADAMARVAAAIVATGLPIALERMPADSPWIDTLCRAYAGGRGWVRIAPAPGCPFIRLGVDWIDPEAHFNAGRRSDIRRARRRAEAMGEVRMEIHAPRPGAELHALIDEAFGVEAAGWKGHCGSALAVDARRGGFFRTYAEEAARKGILRLCFLRIDGEAAAMELAVESDAAFWLLKIGYDERFARCSPGTLLMLHTVGEAARRGLRHYELLGQSAPWTALWTVEERRCVAVRAYPYNVRGARAFCDDLARSARRRLAPGGRAA